MLTRFTRFLAGKKGPRSEAASCSSRPRRLTVECLEQRRLLAADFLGWQNVLEPADVNNDGAVAPADALLVANELYKTGSRYLGPPAASAAPALAASTAASAEGEQPSRFYLDVNGDNYLTPADALLVVAELRAEGQEDLVQFRLETTDLTGVPVSDVLQGEQFVLNVFVQDVRPDTVSARGVFQAYVDVLFDDALVSALEPLSFGAAYQDQVSGDVSTPGLVDEAGGTQTGFGFEPPFDGPLGPGEFFVVGIPFEAAAAGAVTFVSNSADLAGFHDVLLFEPPDTVPADSVIYGTADLTIHAAPVAAFDDTPIVNEDTDNVLDVLANDEVNSGGTLTITGVGAADRGGTVVNNGDHLLYTPAQNFNGTETFTYTIGDGLGNTDQAAVIVTVLNTNDAPLAMNDGGPEYTTDQNTAFTTGDVRDNDTDVDGDQLSVSGLNTAGTRGLVTNNGDGTFDYDPNGQFDQLAFGQSATDKFAYTVIDGDGASDTATVTITVTGALPAAGDVSGLVFADVDNDGKKDRVERAIGDVEVRLVGTDVLGSGVSLSTRTDAQGRYGFGAVIPGVYELIEVQPKFFVDGIDTVNGVRHTGRNDRVRIASDTDLAGLEVTFGERSLQPAFIGVGDSINTSSPEGIVVGFDAKGNQLWYSLLDGWSGVTSVSATLSSSGSKANLRVSRGSAPDLTFSVPTSPIAGQARMMGESSEGRVLQFIGTMDDFLQ